VSVGHGGYRIAPALATLGWQFNDNYMIGRKYIKNVCIETVSDNNIKVMIDTSIDWL